MRRFKSFPVKKREDKIIYGDGIVDGIVLLAISELPYVELCADVSYVKNTSKAIKVSFTNEGVNVEVKVKIHYSQSVTDMAFKIQEAIRHNIEAMTDYHVQGVNVVVNDVLFNEIEEKTTNDIIDEETEEIETDKSEENV
jgi:uncharacterized alkaline shock family protein YloU